MADLNVDFVKLAECLVSPGWRLVLHGSDTTGIHYNLGGVGRILIGNHPPIDLRPHTLIIAPRGEQFVIEAFAKGAPGGHARTVGGTLPEMAPDSIRRFVAGEGGPQVMLICGYFSALFGSSVDLFSALSSPIVEQFTPDDRVDKRLSAALEELVAQEVGTGAMVAALLKQILIMLLRRSLGDMNIWLERFAILSDAQVARVFADMVARPGAPHSVDSLARSAGLSRSVFMARFTNCFGRSPIAILRELRMRLARQLLADGARTIEQIFSEVGYASHSSFVRAFRVAYGQDPSSYRQAATMTRPESTADTL